MTKQPDIVFSFGKNWQKFIGSLNKERIRCAEKSLKNMLKIENLDGKRFLDAGCGSGIFSLAALRLGAEEVVSFDIDEDSVACAKYLRERFGPFPQWHITQQARPWIVTSLKTWINLMLSIRGVCYIILARCGKPSLTSSYLLLQRGLYLSVFIMTREG
jgi:SAM-dependent methyltransferase